VRDLSDAISTLWGVSKEEEAKAASAPTTPTDEPTAPKPGDFLSGLSSTIAGLLSRPAALGMVAPSGMATGNVPVQVGRRDLEAEQLAEQRRTAEGTERILQALTNRPLAIA
jgi:hypothetical protein